MSWLKVNKYLLYKFKLLIREASKESFMKTLLPNKSAFLLSWSTQSTLWALISIMILLDHNAAD